MTRRNLRTMIALLGSGVVLLGVALLVSRWLQRPLPPPPQLAEPTTPEPVPATPRCGALHYGSVIKSAAATYKIPEVSVEQLRQPLRGGNEFRGSQVLTPKGRRGVFETPHLRLSVEIESVVNTDGSQGFRADHLVLRITNKSDAPVAYRVLTRMARPEKCISKADLPHNAIALRPRETVRRTECLYNSKQTLAVTNVDVFELTELGHRYVSRLGPVEGGPFDMRVARAHDRGALPGCRSLPWRDLDTTADIWQAVIDFHARHDCDEYSLPRGYLPFTAPGSLPVCG